MDFKSIFLGLVFVFLWSSAFTSARMIVMDAPPFAALAIRFVLSGVVGLMIARWMGQSWRLTPAQWRATVIFGICQNTIYLGLNFYAMQTVEASLATIIAAAMPLAVAVIGVVVLRDRLPLLGIVGLIAGITGVAIIMSARISGGVDLIGVALCFVAMVSLAVATLMVRSASSGGNLMTVVAMQMLLSAALLAVVSGLTEFPITVNWTPRLITAFLYTTFFPGLLATWIWFVLVGCIGAVKAAAYHFLNPVFGVAVAAVLLGEALSWLDFVGVLIIAGGILAVQLSKQQKLP
ncbi:DMT family transporter [Thalassobium sp. R2A62]|uniref:DMT family transporter n=1 Tax=Thalassobium sp. R2A62 TaxID=633131 RepID=UPI0001B1D555|nr:DMT family transporter [Thalassobium sp. R2A62]EET49518.1 UAA transporter family protein [Thalassobium sp. R2A62]